MTNCHSFSRIFLAAAFASVIGLIFFAWINRWNAVVPATGSAIYVIDRWTGKTFIVVSNKRFLVEDEAADGPWTKYQGDQQR